MELKTIDQLLRYGIFMVPDYQRGYSWGESQLDDFFDDLMDVEYVKNHYAGTITIIKKGTETIGVSPYTLYDIVDGQQRLTTIHILLSALYFRLKNIEQGDEDILRNVIYRERTLLRLNNNQNQIYFENIIKKSISKLNSYNGDNKTQKNLMFAKKYFSNRFQKYSSYRRLLKIYTNLISKFNVNIFELQQESEVGLIFESMNDRGLPLSDIDKIKNYLIYISHRLSDENLARVINRRFGDIFKELMKVQSSFNVTKSENNFLKYSYLIYSGDTRDLKDIHKKIKTELIPKKPIIKNPDLFNNDQQERSKKINEIKDFTSFLVKSSKKYAKILNCDFDDEEVNLGLSKLKLLNKLDNFTPILLAISTNSNWRPHYLKPILKLLEIYTIRVFFIGKKKGNTGISALNDIAFKIRKNNITFTNVKKEIKDLIIKNSQNRRFKKSIIEEEYYGNGIDNMLKYFLYEYENYRAKENNSIYSLPNFKSFFYDKNKFTIEHIHPQNPVPGDKVVVNTDCLGNLVLTKDNGRLDNKTFESKKRIYSTSDLTSENDLTNFEKWGDKEIKNRGKQLSIFGVNKWKIL